MIIKICIMLNLGVCMHVILAQAFLILTTIQSSLGDENAKQASLVYAYFFHDFVN